MTVIKVMAFDSLYQARHKCNFADVQTVTFIAVILVEDIALPFSLLWKWLKDQEKERKNPKC